MKKCTVEIFKLESFFSWRYDAGTTTLSLRFLAAPILLSGIHYIEIRYHALLLSILEYDQIWDLVEEIWDLVEAGQPISEAIFDLCP